MPLDFSRLSSQMPDLTARALDDDADLLSRLDTALVTLGAQSDIVPLRDTIETYRGKYTWLVAGPTEALNTAYDPPDPPPDHVVVATDGSQIDVDRDNPRPWYLLNMGTVYLRYGAQPEATLQSHARVYARDEELVLTDPQNRTQQETIEGALLGYKRAVEEVQTLAEMVRSLPAGMPTLALLDGSLSLWGLGGQSVHEFVRQAFLVDGLLPALDMLRAEADRRPLAVASYISAPRSTEVVNVLRLALCKETFLEPNCNGNCRTVLPLQRACDGVARVADRDVFSQILTSGQRSALFSTHSSVVERYYGPHKVLFFYLNTGREIARVEIPEWVRDAGRLQLLHTLLNDQIALGQGYPVSLAEAHEQAVVRAADRQVFWRMVEEGVQGQAPSRNGSAKARAKGQRLL